MKIEQLKTGLLLSEVEVDCFGGIFTYSEQEDFYEAVAKLFANKTVKIFVEVDNGTTGNKEAKTTP